MDDARAFVGGGKDEEGECLLAGAAAFLLLDEAEAEEAVRWRFFSREASLALPGRSIG